MWAVIAFAGLLLFLKYVPNFIPGLEKWTCPKYHLLEPEEIEDACQLWSPDIESYDQALELLIVGNVALTLTWFLLFHAESTRDVLREGELAQVVVHAGSPLLTAIFVFTATVALEQVVNEKRHKDLLLPVYILRSYRLLKLLFAVLDGVEVELEEEVLKDRLMVEHPVYWGARLDVNSALMTGVAAKDALWESDVLLDEEGCDRDMLAMTLLRHMWYPFSRLTKLTICAVVLARWSGLDMTASALGALYFALSLGTSVMTGMAYIPRVAGALAVYTGNLFKVGERVSFCAGTSEVVGGWVKRVTMLSVQILNDDHRIVSVPNQLLRDFLVVNISRTSRNTARLAFTCSARCAPEQVDALAAHLREFASRYASCDTAAAFAGKTRCFCVGFNESGFAMEWRMVLRAGESPFEAKHDLTLAVARAARRLCIPIVFKTITVNGLDGIPLLPANGVAAPAPSDAPPEWTPAKLALAASPLDGGRITHYIGAPPDQIPATDDLLPPPRARDTSTRAPRAYSLRIEFVAVRTSEATSMRRRAAFLVESKLVSGRDESARTDAGACVQMRPDAVGGEPGVFTWPAELPNYVSLRVSREVAVAGCLAVCVNDMQHRRVATAVFRMWQIRPGPGEQTLVAPMLAKRFRKAGSVELKLILLELDDDAVDGQ
jgi:hypothetical protein